MTINPKDLPTGAQIALATKLGHDPRDLWPELCGTALDPVYVGPVLVSLKDNKPTKSRYTVLESATAELMNTLAGKVLNLYESDKRERVTAELSEWARDGSALSARLTVTSAGKREIGRGEELSMSISLRCKLDANGTVLEILDGVFAQADRAPETAAQFHALTADQIKTCTRLGYDPMAIAREPGLLRNGR